MNLDDDDRAMLQAVRHYLEAVHAAVMGASDGASIADVVAEHLGEDAASLPIVEESIPAHRFVDADIALEVMAQAGDGRLVGVGGGDQRMHLGFADLVRSSMQHFGLGPVDAVSRATGESSTREVVTFGVWLLRHEGVPIAVLQRDAAPRFGREQASLEVVGADRGIVAAFLAAVRATMIDRSVLRGAVLTFAHDPQWHVVTTAFMPRPDVDRSEIVLPAGVLERVEAQVTGLGAHRDALRAHGQHLKRGVLLYGPPGTGKTLTVRSLLAQANQTTAVVLTGAGIAHISAAAAVARMFQPSIVVLEDVDLVAMERGASPQPLLFEILDALDGLDGDADVTFILTTNRVDVLEQALVQRPGRVDLAVEIPLPGDDERRRMLTRLGGGSFSPDAIDRAAAASPGTTGSFGKELVRRAMLRAAMADREPVDADLDAALDDLLDARDHLTRRMLGDAGAGLATSD